MRVYWADESAMLLNLEAETSAELVLIGQLAMGPLSGALQLSQPSRDDDDDRGLHFYHFGQKAMHQVTGLQWGVRGLGAYRAPAPALEAQAAEQLGRAVFKCLDVFHAQRAIHLPGATAGVVAVKPEG